MSNTVSTKMTLAPENRLYENINLSTYVCDFGNVVMNSVKVRTIIFTNIGPTPLELMFDTRAARAAGFTMPERPPKVQPNSEIAIKISYTAKNKIKYGRNKCLVPVEVRHGAKYCLELLSNITIPEITVENLTEDTLDFGKVIIGQRKTFFLRLVNDKEIPCAWTLNTRADGALTGGDKKKDENKFALTPASGIIPSGSKMIVEITFCPTGENLYQHRFTLNIAENPKPFHVPVKGNGAAANLEFFPTLLPIGPVLPYDNFSHAVLEVRNPSTYSTELFSLDFDKQYLEEEEILAYFDGFEGVDHLFVPVREPG